MDLNDLRFQALAKIAERIVTLLETQAATSNTELFSALDDLLGAVYARVFAHRDGFKERRNQKQELKPPRTRARQLEQGQVRLSGVWMAGFHFNSALYRIAAVYHRALKLVAFNKTLQKRKRPTVDYLLLDVKTALPEVDASKPDGSAERGEPTEPTRAAESTRRGVYRSMRQFAPQRNCSI